MLKFPRDFVDDPKANQIVKQYLNQRIVTLMKDIMQEQATISGDMNEELLYPYFPDHFNPALRPVVFSGLYELLTAKEEQVPTLIMEYVMNALFEVYSDTCDLLLED